MTATIHVGPISGGLDKPQRVTLLVSYAGHKEARIELAGIVENFPGESGEKAYHRALKELVDSLSEEASSQRPIQWHIPPRRS